MLRQFVFHFKMTVSLNHFFDSNFVSTYYIKLRNSFLDLLLVSNFETNLVKLMPGYSYILLIAGFNTDLLNIMKFYCNQHTTMPM